MEFATATPKQYRSVDQEDLQFSNTIPGQRSRHASLTSEEIPHDGDQLKTTRNGPSTGTRIGGGNRAILLSVLVIVLPMAGLAALLLGLVLGNEIQRQDSSTLNPLSADQDPLDSNAYYVDFNPTTLVTIASWSSTVAPLLAVSAMVLISFPIARQMQMETQMNESSLPTPYQLALLLDSMSAGIMPLWSFLGYRRWKHRANLAPTVRSALILLAAFTALGYTIAAVDTWLHLVMDAVNIDLAETRSPQAALGRGLPAGPCSNQTTADFDAGDCSINSGSNVFLVGAAEAARAMGNTSTLNAVYETIVDGKHMAYLGPASNPRELDYRADALAVHTTCHQIGKQCGLKTDAASVRFNCTDELYGDLAQPSINGARQDGVTGLPLRNAGVVFYQDAALTRLANDSADDTYLTRPANPQHLAAWAKIELPANDEQIEDGNVVVPMHGGTTWVLNCTATAYQITYDFVNGSIRHADAQVANGSVGTILHSAAYYGFGKVSLETAAYAASQYNSTQAMADDWASAYSVAALALSSGFMAPRANLEEQVRSSKLVSRVPKAPLYTLVALNCVYALSGLVLAWFAARAEPEKTNDLRERLSTSALVAFCFEGDRARRAVEKKRELFDEHAGVGTGRVGLARAQEGGVSFVRRQRATELGRYDESTGGMRL